MNKRAKVKTQKHKIEPRVIYKPNIDVFSVKKGHLIISHAKGEETLDYRADLVH